VVGIVVLLEEECLAVQPALEFVPLALEALELVVVLVPVIGDCRGEVVARAAAGARGRTGGGP